MRTPTIRTSIKRTILFSCAFTVAACSSTPKNDIGVSEPESYQRVAQQSRMPGDGIVRHAYVSTGLGASRMNPDTSEVPAYDVNDRYEAGGQISVGVDLSRQLAVEMHSADLGSAGLSPGGRINYHIHGASALFYAGKNRHNFKRRGLSGYGRIGMGYLENSAEGNVPFVKDNSTHLLFGAGVEYMTKIGLGLRFEGIAYEEDAQYAQLGLIYRMGGKQQSKPVQIAQVPEPEKPVIIAAAKPIVVDPCDEFTGVIQGVNFHNNSAKLTVNAKQILNTAAVSLSECNSVPVKLTAHTDGSGTESYNFELSRRRASSVKTYLTSQGIDVDRIETQAFGESMPIDSNSTAEGRKRNRRVELIAQ